MKKQFINWIPVLSPASFVSAVFMIAGGYYWPGIAFVGVGASLYSVAAIHKRKSDVSDENRKTK